MNIQEIDISKLFVGECNVRKDIGEISDLTKSIQEQGILEPLLIRPVGERFEVIVGSRRLTAAKAAGLKTVSAIVRQMSDSEALVASLVENIQREAIDPEDIVKTYQKLNDLTGRKVSMEEFAKQIGKTKAWVSMLVTGYETLEALKAAGITKGMVDHPTKEERAEGFAPITHLVYLGQTLDNPNVKQIFTQKELEDKRVEIARIILSHSQDEAKAILDGFRTEPRKPITEIEAKVLGVKPKVRIAGKEMSIKVKLTIKLAKALKIASRKERISVEEYILTAIEKKLKRSKFL